LLPATLVDFLIRWWTVKNVMSVSVRTNWSKIFAPSMILQSKEA
jgi:glyS_dimeric: glycyl-tRNA synthetase